MGVNRAKRRRVLRRDNWVCGEHLGGCLRKLTCSQHVNVDHIIPQAYFKHLTRNGYNGYNADWNLQPTCVECNTAKKGQLHRWPLFQCRCHYLCIDDKGGMFINERTGPQEEKHLLMKGVVDDGDAVQFRVIVGKGSYKEPGGENWRGFGRAEESPFPVEMGHLLPGIHHSQIVAFNWFERARVGLAEGSLVSESKGKRYIFHSDGTIHHHRTNLCVGQFDVSKGYTNIYLDPSK